MGLHLEKNGKKQEAKKQEAKKQKLFRKRQYDIGKKNVMGFDERKD